MNEDMPDEFSEALKRLIDIVQPYSPRREFGNPRVETDEVGEYRSIKVVYTRVANRISWIDLRYHKPTGRWGLLPAGRVSFHKGFDNLDSALAYMRNEVESLDKKRRDAIKENKRRLEKACEKCKIEVKDAYDPAEIEYWKGLK